jgi:F0F1-type ATP synthase assembly protein I
MLSSAARQAMRILVWQLLGLLTLGLVAWWYDGRVARSVLVGGGIGLLATAYLLFVLIKHSLQPARPATVLSLFGNWLVKTGLVLGLLALALRSPTLLPAAVLLGLASSLLIYWLSMLGR